MVPRVEEMLILKPGAFYDRKSSIKGQKDRVDIAGLVFYSTVDYSRLRVLLNQYKKESYMDLLLDAVGNIDRHLLPYLNLNESTYSKIRKRTLDAITN